MVMAAAVARVSGLSRGLGQVGLLLLRRLGAAGLARSVSNWSTGESSSRGNRDVNASFSEWRLCRERRKGCHRRRDKGRETLNGKASIPVKRKSEAAPLGVLKEGCKLERRKGFLISCHPSPREGWSLGGTREGGENVALWGCTPWGVESETALVRERLCFR